MCSIPGLPAPGSTLPVRITRVNLNPSHGVVELWVNSNDDRKHIFERMMEEIQIPKRRFCEMEGRCGDLCLVCINNVWHRARIVSIHQQSYNIFLIDQGQPHAARSETLAWGQSDSFHLPPKIESCILANVVSVDNNWPQRATKFLNSLPGKRFNGLVQHVLMPDRTFILDIPIISKYMFKVGVARKLPVDQFKCFVLESLNLPNQEASDVCHEEKKGNLSSHPEKLNQYFYPELQTETYETVEVTEINDPEKIFCKLLIFSTSLKILSERIHQHYEVKSSDLGDAQPQACGAPCAAKGINGRWHRSLLKQNILADDPTVEVLHVDCGKTELVAVGDIRPLHEKFQRMPVFTYMCSLDGVKDNGTRWSEDQIDCLKSLLLNQTVVARFDSYNAFQNIYHVTLFEGSGACLNTCFMEKVGYLPDSKTENDSNVQSESLPSSILMAIGDEQNIHFPNKADLHVDELQEETLERTKNGGDDVGKDHMDSLDNNSSREHPDAHPVEQNGPHDGIFPVGSTIGVKISCIESLQKFWCQNTDNGDSLKLLMHDMKNHYASAHPQPLVDSVCVARHPENGLWYRTRIIASQHSPVVDVRFIDYGENRKVPLRDVRPIDPAFLRLDAQAFQCCLSRQKHPADPVTATWSDAALPEFQKIVDSVLELKCSVKAVTSDREGLPLNVVDIETQSGSASELMAEKCPEAGASSLVSSRAYLYSTHNIEVGGKEKVLITCSQTVDHFYCQLNRNLNVIAKLSKDVGQLIGQPVCTNQPLGVSSVCFARYTDNQWYRGQVMSPFPNLQVHFVDYGDTLTLKQSDVCPLATEESLIRDVPMQAIPLSLFKVPADVPQEIHKWFADQAVGHNFTISVVAKASDGKLIVKLYDGSLNVNQLVRERIGKVKQRKGTDPKANVLNCQTQNHVDVSPSRMKMNQNKVHSSDRMCAGAAVKTNNKSTTEISAPQHGTFTCSFVKETGNVWNVILKDKEVVLSERLLQSGHNVKHLSLPSIPEENVDVCMYKSPDVSPNKTEEVYASCIVGPHYFWCQYANTEDLNKVSELAQALGRATPDAVSPETLDPGSPCLALFSSDNKWYRAQVTGRSDNSLSLLSIDYGNESEVDIKDVRSIPPSLLEKAPQAFLCSLDGFDTSKGSWDDGVYDDFYSHLVDKLLSVTVLNMENRPCAAVPQYAVKVECENVVLNTEMQKHWKASCTEHVTAEKPPAEVFSQNGQSELNVMHKNLNTCKYKKPNMSQNKTEQVYASCIVGPQYFWCQYANTEDMSKVAKLAQEVGHGVSDTMSPGSLDPGSPCLALFSSDNQWYRAQVIRRTADHLSVLFIDYGNEAEVDINDVRSIPPCLMEKDPQAFLCSLDGFDESKGSWDDGVYDDFYNFVLDKQLDMTMASNMEDHTETGVPQYAVRIECESMIVNTEMQKYWKAFAIEIATTEKLVTSDFLPDGHMESSGSNRILKTCKYTKPNVSRSKTEEVYASCIVGPDYFWCQHANAEELNQVSALAQEVGNAEQDAVSQRTPDLGSPCLALFSSDNQWYRAQVIHRTDDTLCVLFMDYGNESEVNIKGVRSIPPSLMEKAPQAFLCALDGFDSCKGSWDDGVYDDFYNLLIDKHISVTVLNMVDHPEIGVPQYTVKIDCENMDVTTVMGQKHCKGFATDDTKAESLEPGDQAKDE
ncbi:tudor domain-containing 6 [Genypterus blacodes]|uniref:tudor domain-containing 6 n=1 Tax=Genypterus blacodes TaxID=154954 RepID=UPI003F778075